MIGRMLMDIVEEYALKEGGSAHDIRRYYAYAVAGLRDLSYDLTGALKTKKLTLDDAGGAYFPDDMINLIDVFTINQSGKKNYIVRNTNLNADILCEMVAPSDRGTFIPGGTYHTRRGTLIGRLYGQSGKNNNGEYNLNLKEGYINFDSDFTYDTVYITYLGNPNMIDDDYVVGPFMEPALEAWIYYDSIARSKTISSREKQAALSFYVTQKAKLAKRLSPMTKQDIKATYRKGTRLAPKI